jgi:hypothetical protein
VPLTNEDFLGQARNYNFLQKNPARQMIALLGDDSEASYATLGWRQIPSVPVQALHFQNYQYEM